MSAAATTHGVSAVLAVAVLAIAVLASHVAVLARHGHFILIPEIFYTRTGRF